MATTIGRVDFVVGLDGRNVPRQARTEGEKIAAAMGRGFGNKFQSNIRGVTSSLTTQSSAWRQLSANTRQWILISGAVVAAGESIAALGSAITPGLFNLGAAFTSLGIGAGVTISAFVGLGGELDGIPAAARPAAEAMRRLGDAFGVLGDEITVAAFGNAAKDFDSLGDTVRGLSPAFQRVAKVVGSLFSDFAKNIAPGTKGFETLNKLVDIAADQFDKMVRTLGKVAQAFGNVFTNPAVQKSVNNLIDGVDGLVEKFLEFTESDGLGRWWSRADRIFASLGGLLTATATMFSNLVDDGAITRLTNFIDTLAAFMPNLEDLFNIFGELDIFGLLAEALNDISDALQPLAGPLTDFATGLNAVVHSGIDQLAGFIEPIAAALAPFVQGLADFMNENPDAIASGILGIAAAFVVLKGIDGIAGVAAAVGGLKSSFKGLTWKSLLGGLTIGALGAWIVSQFTIEDSDVDASSQKLSSGLTAVIVGAFAGLQVGGPIGALIGAAAAAIVTRLTQEWDLLTSEIDWNPFNGSKNAVDWGEFGAQFAEDLPQFFENIAPAWVEGWETSLFSVARTAINDFFTGLPASLAGWWAPIQAQLDADLATMGATWAGWVAGLQIGWDTFWASLPNALSAAWTVISTTVTTGWTTVTTAFTSFTGTLVGMWNGFWTGLSGLAAGAWAVITGVVSGAWSTITGAFTGAIGTLVGMWNGFWSGLGGVVGGVWAGIVSTVRGAVNTVIGIINGMISAINRAIGSIESLSGGLINLPNIPNLPKAAAGMAATTGPTLAGEAGAEMIIPLTRPLSQVDPAVRAIAAAIRGNGSIGSGTSGLGASKVTHVEAGAITIVEAGNGRQTATAVLDRLVED